MGSGTGVCTVATAAIIMKGGQVALYALGLSY